MDMWLDLFGTWSGVLTVAVVILTALAIPLGVVYMLHHDMRGPANRKAEKYEAEHPGH